MNFREYREYVLGDLHRHNPQEKDLIRHLVTVPGFCYSFWMRTAMYLRTVPGNSGRVGHILARMILKRYSYRYGIDIPYNTEIGHGLYIGHHGGIVVSPDAKIGRNCNINHGVTIGTTYGGKNPGAPVIGDCVYLGPGCKVIGGITVGNNVAVGANAVVTSSVPDNAVVVGIPARVISYKGSVDYIADTV